MTFGDVLAITLLIVVTIVTLWAGIVAFTVVFSRRAQVAANSLTDAPGRQVGVGAVIAVIAGTLSVVLMGRGGPVAAFGFAVLAAALAVAVLGSAGLALVVSGRLRELDPRYSALSATTRGAALAVAAGLIPIIGWFFLMPAALFASLGAGFTAMRIKKQKQTVTQPEPQSIPVAADL